MIIDFKFEIGEQVYYVDFENTLLSSTHKRYMVKQGNIYGFSCLKRNNKLLIRVDFRGRNGVPIDYIFNDENKAKEKARELGGNFYCND